MPSNSATWDMGQPSLAMPRRSMPLGQSPTARAERRCGPRALFLTGRADARRPARPAGRERVEPVEDVGEHPPGLADGLATGGDAAGVGVAQGRGRSLIGEPTKYLTACRGRADTGRMDRDDASALITTEPTYQESGAGLVCRLCGLLVPRGQLWARDTHDRWHAAVATLPTPPKETWATSSLLR